MTRRRWALPVLVMPPRCRRLRLSSAPRLARLVQSGDLLVVYSDGILEASDSQEQEFGEERLIAAAQRNRSKSPVDICEAILAACNLLLGKKCPRTIRRC